MNRYIVPRFGFVLVAGVAAILITIVARSPDTHGNVWSQVPPDYARTEVAVVGENGASTTLPVIAGSHGSRIALTLPDLTFEGRTPPLDPGKRIYVQAGCATCHGVDAQGGPVAPPLAGATPEIVRRMVREGPAGMVAYATDTLNDADLEAIASYLQALPTAPRPSTEQLAAIQRLTYDPAVPISVLLRGKAALRRSCGACHAQPGTEDILKAFGSDAKAAGVVAEMVQNTHVSVEDARAMAYYMLAIRNGFDPVKHR